MKTILDGQIKVFESSISQVPGATLYMAATDSGDQLLVLCTNPGFADAQALPGQEGAWLAPLSSPNASLLRQLLPHTAPRPGLAGSCSMGVGDRLGIASEGHLQAFAEYPQVFPVLAQQSIRELHLTGRGYQEVLDAATFAVFRAGYTGGFGADGDHLKKPEEIEYALACGFSMITLDVSEHIKGDVHQMDDQAVEAAWDKDDQLTDRYLGHTFHLGDGVSLVFDRPQLLRAALVYGEAIEYMDSIYQRYIKGGAVDFEISIDETANATTPLEHFFVANELRLRGVVCQSLAPRFCGEFQKGIDYIGDLAQFDRELAIHVAIARHFGYKISVHSGSDKFSVFPSVGRHTKGVFHLKTAGTNWLEAVRLVAMKDPALYRQMHQFALDHFAEASKYYHVKADLKSIPALSGLEDSELPSLMDQEDARQLLHITYGLILTAKTPEGSNLFKDKLYTLWAQHRQDYAALLKGHIGRHLNLLLDGEES